MKGNPDVHVILRGGTKGPNYATEYVRECGEKVMKAGLPVKVMVRAGLPCVQFAGLTRLSSPGRLQPREQFEAAPETD